MYAIAQVIYGVPINDSLYDKIAQELKNEEWDEVYDDNFGILRWYSGAGTTPMGFGVELTEFDEASNFRLDKLNDKVKQKIKQAEKKTINLYSKLPEGIKKHINPKDFDIWIIWSTS